MITFGESFHWLETERILPILKKILSESSDHGLLVLFGYWGFEIMTENAEELVRTKYKLIDDFEKFLPER